MRNKFLEKLAGKLPTEAKAYASKLITSARARGKPVQKGGLVNALLKPSDPGSFGHETLRARKVAARATRDDRVRGSMQKAASVNPFDLLTKLSSLLKNRKLLAKITSKTKQDRLKLFAKSPGEAKASNNIIDAHEMTEKAVDKGQKIKARFSYTDGTKAFVRATPGKGVRTRLYGKQD